MSGERQKQKESEELPFNSHWVPGKVCLDAYSFVSAEPLALACLCNSTATRNPNVCAGTIPSRG